MDIQSTTAAPATTTRKRSRGKGNYQRTSWKSRALTAEAALETANRKIAKLESARDSTVDTGLILKASETGYRAGVEAGLMLQGTK